MTAQAPAEGCGCGILVLDTIGAKAIVFRGNICGAAAVWECGRAPQQYLVEYYIEGWTIYHFDYLQFGKLPATRVIWFHANHSGKYTCIYIYTIYVYMYIYYIDIYTICVYI